MYSNIDYKWLLNTASTALDELNRNTLNSVETSITSFNVLPSEIRSVVKNTIHDINKKSSLTGNIETLKFHLNKLVKAASKIGDYQVKEEQIRNFKRYMDHEDAADCRRLKTLQKELENIKKSIDSILDGEKSSFF